MSYLKLKADKIFDGLKFLEEDVVLITDEGGKIEEIVATKDAGENIQYLEGILSPGFINCHCHLELSHLRGAIPEKTGLVNFVWDVITKRNISEAEVLTAIQLAENEMKMNGIVAVGDICNTTLTIAQKKNSSLWYHNFIEISGFNPAVAMDRFNQGVANFSLFEQQNTTERWTNSIVPHAPYSVSAALWNLIIQFQQQSLLTIHNQEDEAENELFQFKKGGFIALYEKLGIENYDFQPTGKTSLQSYLPSIQSVQSILLVHNVVSSEEDIIFAKAVTNQLNWCLCPNANIYISGQLPAIDMLQKHNCEIVLGTDSLASNHQLSILEEMKTIQRFYPDIQIETLLKWATHNGAKALQLQDKLGSFEKHKQPGILLIDSNFKQVKRIV